MQNLLRFFLIFLALYLTSDGTIHLLNIRLISVTNIWPKSAISYATLLNAIYASFVFLAAILVFAAQKDLKKYKNLVFASVIWALIHGFLLTILSISQNFNQQFQAAPSLQVWFPFYNQYLLFEAILAFAYAAVGLLWLKGFKQ